MTPDRTLDTSRATLASRLGFSGALEMLQYWGRVRASAVASSIVAPTLVVAWSAEGGIKHSSEAAHSSGQRASSGGTGDATVRAGDSGRVM
jgi:hypothetical protein